MELDEIKRQDSYYFDKNGIKIYEIESYAIKTKENRDRNNTKGLYLNKAILSILIGSIVVVAIIFIKSFFVWIYKDLVSGGVGGLIGGGDGLFSASNLTIISRY